jgi:hypothetical protein
MARLQLCVSLDARDQLDRLSWHYRCGLTELVEQLAAAAERAVEANLSDKALKVYRVGCNDTAQ